MLYDFEHLRSTRQPKEERFISRVLFLHRTDGSGTDTHTYTVDTLKTRLYTHDLVIVHDDRDLVSRHVSLQTLIELPHPHRFTSIRAELLESPTSFSSSPRSARNFLPFFSHPAKILMSTPVSASLHLSRCRSIDAR